MLVGCQYTCRMWLYLWDVTMACVLHPPHGLCAQRLGPGTWLIQSGLISQSENIDFVYMFNAFSVRAPTTSCSNHLVDTTFNYIFHSGLPGKCLYDSPENTPLRRRLHRHPIYGYILPEICILDIWTCILGVFPGWPSCGPNKTRFILGPGPL